MSDFFGEYFAPGAFFTGAGITAYRAAQDIKSKGSLSTTWREQADSKNFYESFKRKRSERFGMSTEDLLDSMS